MIIPTEPKVFFKYEDLVAEFSQFDLTQDQLQALEQVIAFLNSDDNIFMLKGFAGTGKTFILHGLCSFLGKHNINNLALAPTGKAARVLEDKVGFGGTIHSAIYGEPQVVSFGTDKTKKYVYKIKFNLKSNQKVSFDEVFIVDEASMVSDNYSDNSVYLFGSGKLLQDLFYFIDFKGAPQRKLIFVGDSAQLPPVGMSFSPAFSKEYLQKNYGYSAKEVFLEEVVRQKAQSTILKNAFQLRTQINKKRFTSLKLDLTYKDCFEIKSREVAASYLAYCKAPGHGFYKTCIITYSNSLAAQYNLQVRAIRFPDCKYMQRNDLLIVMVNNYLFDFNNGDFILVKNILAEHYCFDSIYNKKDLNTERTVTLPIKLYFTYAKVSYQLANGSISEKEVWINENLLYTEHSNDNDLDEHIGQALYINAIKRFEQENPLKPKKEFGANADVAYAIYRENRQQKLESFLKKDPFLNALKVKFGYAITCHKAQGSEWDRVYVDCKHSSKNKLNEQYFRWLYTAITRAQQELVLINPPQITMGSNVKFVGFTAQSILETKPQSTASHEDLVQNSIKQPKLSDPLSVKTIYDQKNGAKVLEENREEFLSDDILTQGVFAPQGPQEDFEPLEDDDLTYNFAGELNLEPKIEVEPKFNVAQESVLEQTPNKALETKFDPKPHFETMHTDFGFTSKPDAKAQVLDQETKNYEQNIKPADATSFEKTSNKSLLSPEDYFSSLIFETLVGFKVENFNIQDFSYQKRIFMTVNNESLQYDVYYNGKNELTRVLNKDQSQSPLAIQIFKLLQALKGRNIFESEQTPQEVEATLEPDLQDITYKLRKAFYEHGLKIIKLTPGQFMLNYILQSGEEKGEIVIRYNGKYNVSNCEPLRRKGQAPISNKLLSKVYEAVSSL